MELMRAKTTTIFKFLAGFLYGMVENIYLYRTQGSYFDGRASASEVCFPFAEKQNK